MWVKRHLKYFVHPALLPQQPNILTYKTYEEFELNSVHSNELETESRTRADLTLSIVGSVSGYTLSPGEAAGDNQPPASSNIRHGDLQVYNDIEPRELHSSTPNIQGSVSGFTPGFSETANANELAAFIEPEAGTTEKAHREIDVGVRLISTSPTSPELGLSSLRLVSGSTLSLRESNDEHGLIVSYSGRNDILNTDGIEAKRESLISNSNMDLLFTTLELLGRPDSASDTRTVEVIYGHKLNHRGTFLPIDTASSRHLGVEVALPDDEGLDGDTLNSTASTIFANLGCSLQLSAALPYLGEDTEKRDNFKNTPEPIVEASGCSVAISSIVNEDSELTSEPYLLHLDTPPRVVNVEQSITEDQRLRAAYERHIITSDIHDKLLTTGTDRHAPSAINILDVGTQNTSDEREALLLEMVLLLEDIAQDLNARHKKVGPAPKLCNLDSRQETAVEGQRVVGPIESSVKLQILLGILPWFLYLSLGFYKTVL